MHPIDHDYELAIEVCEQLPKGWVPLVDALRAGSVYMIAEGSSRLLPLGLARHWARLWGNLRVDGSGGRFVPPRVDGRILALSNSGRTREVREAIGQREFLAVCGVAHSPLSRSAKSSLAVLPRPERAVASTAAVLGQSLVVTESMALARGVKVERSTLTEALVEFEVTPPPAARRLWLVGAEDGCAEELALKAWEMAALPAIPVPAGLALHGLEEVLQHGDVVWVLDELREDLPRIRQRLSSTGAQLFCPRLPQIGLLQPLIRLVAGWKYCAFWARSRGRDPGQTRRARKIGNDMGTPDE